MKGPCALVGRTAATLAIRARVPLEVLSDTIQPFPSFSVIFAAALKQLRGQIATAMRQSVHSTAGWRRGPNDIPAECQLGAASRR